MTRLQIHWNREKCKNFMLSAGCILFLLILWQVCAMMFHFKKFPDPITVIRDFFLSFIEPVGRYTLPQHLLWSLSRVCVGYALAAVAGIILGFGMGCSEVIRAAVAPLFDFLRPIPPIAWTPLAILWFGVAEKPKYFMIFIAGLIAFTLNAYTGATHVDNQLVGAARMLGANTRQVFFKVIIPSTVPHIFAGAQVALSTCWMAVLGAEMIKSSEGAGWIMMTGNDSGDISQIIVGMIAIAVTGFALVNLIQFCERRLAPWNIKSK